MNNETLIVRLISAVLANVTANPDGTLNINLTIATEMVENVLVEHQIVQIEKRKRN